MNKEQPEWERTLEEIMRGFMATPSKNLYYENTLVPFIRSLILEERKDAYEEGKRI